MDTEELDRLRHSTAHVMAEAVGDLFEEATFGIGPSIEDGFYYDFDVDRPFTPEDLERIEARMREIIAQKRPFEQRIVGVDEAKRLMDGQPYKLELIDELPSDEDISIYTHGSFVDLCRGPHVEDVGELGHFKLTKLAGAYWHGDSDREMLQRIYGTAWDSEEALDEYLTRMQEAEKRDHRKLGRELDLFSFHDEAGAGLPLYHPKGARIMRVLQDWLRKELYARGYVEVITPHVYKSDVWKRSGHWDNYRENMYFFEVDDGDEDHPRINEYGIKPMNCPAHMMIYGNDLHSYRDLPIRLSEFGTVYRHELSGVVHGLMRARSFTQDDAHIFCTADQVKDEVNGMLDLVDFIMDTFGFTYTAELSTRPAKSMGTDADWEFTTAVLRDTLDERGIAYTINEGDGAFYGPKIDIHLRDAIGRTWQLSTIQFDALLPEKFDLEYRTADNAIARPFMLHRAILGSMERFLGILIEHYAGALPVWLAPVQATIIPISDDQLDAARSIEAQLAKADVRVEIDDSAERMGAKIAKATAQKVPYMLVLGKREVEGGVVAVRDRTEGDIGTKTVDEFVDLIASHHPSLR